MRDPWGDLCFVCQLPINHGGSLCLDCTAFLGQTSTALALMRPHDIVKVGEEVNLIKSQYNYRIRLLRTLNQILYKRCS